MLTDFYLGLTCANTGQALEISLADSHGQISSIRPSPGQFNLAGKISLPNRITLTLTDLGKHGAKEVVLDSMILGSLEVPVSTLDQICRFQPIDADSEMVIRRWWCEGTVIIDLFSKDWVQFHLTYDHKIVP